MYKNSRQSITITVYESSCEINITTLNKLIMDTVPIEYQGTVELSTETGCHPYSDDYYSTLYVTYKRPENDEEFKLRCEIEAKRVEVQRARELAYFEQLKAKYEPVVKKSRACFSGDMGAQSPNR